MTTHCILCICLISFYVAIAQKQEATTVVHTRKEILYQNAEETAPETEFKTAAHYTNIHPFLVLSEKPLESHDSWRRPKIRGGHLSKRIIPSTSSVWPQASIGSGRSNQKIPDVLRLLETTKFLELLVTYGLDRMLYGPKTFTVFVPSNSAITNFIQEFPNAGADQDDMKSLLFNHMVQDKISSRDMRPGISLITMAGSKLSIEQSKERIFTVAGVKLRASKIDKFAENGVIHVIDQVIFPFPAKNSKKSKFGDGIEDDGPIAKTKMGKLMGRTFDENVNAWLGIPYAKPPIGSLRFGPPKPIDGELSSNADPIFRAQTLPNACPQSLDFAFGKTFEGTKVWNPNTNRSEDCLYLSIYAPQDLKKDEDLPVLVWIYGGGYMTGSGALDIYDPAELVRRGRLVYVAMQYRVGSHGFLYLGADSKIPGNMGLLDQNLALKWIQKNIDAFGGNPNQITLMGESAGASSIALHLVSPMSQGLFNKVILQSTGLVPRWGFVSPATALKRARLLAKSVGCDVDDDTEIDEIEACLRNTSSDDMVNNEYSVEDYTLNLFPFVPTVDATFLTDSPSNISKNLGKFINKEIDVLLGSNSNEGFWSLMYFLTDTFKNEELTVKQRTISQDTFKTAIDSLFPYYNEGIKSLLKFVYRNKTNDRTELFEKIDELVADSDFVCNTEQFANQLSDLGLRVYRYYYNHRASNDHWPSWSGSKHGDEIGFIFGQPLVSPHIFQSSEIKLSHDMITYWTNFAKNGSPNSGSFLSSWPVYKEPEWEYYNFTAGTTRKTGFRRLHDRCSIWNEIIPNLISQRSDKNQCEENE